MRVNTEKYKIMTSSTVSSVTLAKAIISAIHRRARSTGARAVNQSLHGEAQVSNFIRSDRDVALSQGWCKR